MGRQWTHKVVKRMLAMLERLRAENARLREALDHVAHSPQTNCIYYEAHGQRCDCVGDLVRKVLRETQGSAAWDVSEDRED